MRAHGWVAGLMVVAALCGWAQLGKAANTLKYPYSIEEEIGSLIAAGAHESSDPVFLIKLAGLYLDAGDDLYTKKEKRLQAYEEGATIALNAIQVQELNAEAHFLYAANLGSAARLKGIFASALTVGTLKKHASRALELEPDYPAALHMMGMLLEELPTMLGGDSEEALRLLERAVELDPRYTAARLDLAKAYLKRKEISAAKKELRAVIDTKQPTNPYSWSRRHKPEAERLLDSLSKQ